jgi:TRAP-type C4-dicarboxylate transport system substrate-binding protein
MLGRRTVLGAAAAAAVALSAVAAPAQEATLRAVSAFQEGTIFSKPFEEFIAKVNEEGRGLVRIQFVGGPRAMPPFEMGNALRNGVVDMINSTAAFYENLMPEGAALKLTTRPWEEVRANGGWTFMNELHNAKVNAWYLARHGQGIPFHLYLNREIAGPDLNGLSIRVSPVYRAFFAELGANLVNTAPGEVYTALERNVVQGYGWPAIGIFDLGWHERTRFRVDPGFYAVEVNVLVNLDRWRSMTDAQREFLTRMGAWLEERQRQVNPELVAAEYARQDQAGIRPIVFSDAQREAWVRQAREAGWAEIRRAMPDQHDRLRAFLSAE